MYSSHNTGQRSRKTLAKEQVIRCREDVERHLAKKHLPPFGELRIDDTTYYYEYTEYLPYQLWRGHTVNPFCNHKFFLVNIVATILSQNAWLVNKKQFLLLYFSQGPSIITSTLHVFNFFLKKDKKNCKSGIK
jgi:hypothetical protein